jgi:hypothetical protein
MREYVLVKMPKESRKKLGEIAGAFDILKQDAAEMIISERHRSIFGGNENASQGFKRNGTPRSSVDMDGSFQMETSHYTSAIARMSNERKADILDAIYAKAGAEYAVMPQLDELLEAALAPIFDEMDRRKSKKGRRAEEGSEGVSNGR